MSGLVRLSGIESGMITSISLLLQACKQKPMMLPLDLEDWLTEMGDQIVRKPASEGEAALTAREQLIYDIWILDTEARNGARPQNFAARRVKQRACGPATMTHLAGAILTPLRRPPSR